MIQGDELKFKKLGISSPLQLALILPCSYEDLNLYSALCSDCYGAFDATVMGISRTPKTIVIELFCHNINQSLQAVFFAPKPYILRQFTLNERYFLYGKITSSNNIYSLVQPKKITKIGGILSKYKTKLRTDVMRRLHEKYTTVVNLVGYGLKSEIAQAIYELHFPQKLADVANVSKSERFTKRQLRALKYLELFVTLKQLSRKKKYIKAAHSLTSDYKPWLNTLPFALTQQQLKAIQDIQIDFAKQTAARRMIIGDVGSGKTMVMFASVLMARPYRAVLMVPTTLLANQLYEEAKKFLPDTKVVLVTGKSLKRDLQEYDFIIATHAILYRPLPKIDLIMIDEQHRFGTAQRNLLNKLVKDENSGAHFLQFSATPIPRTQAMVQSAYIDVSLIDSTPFKKDITSTVVHKQDFKALLEHITSEIKQHHQVLLVYPLVQKNESFAYQSIEEASSFWQSRFDNVYITHGKDKEKERVLRDFRDGGDLLIATTVVEVGISLPRLSTVVIVGAERLGLSTLHQLRGRVSRNGLRGYCFLFTYQDSSKRLEQFCQTDNGFDIAKLDLKFRKSGDILTGVHQSGLEFKWVDLGEDEELIKEVQKDLKHYNE